VRSGQAATAATETRVAAGARTMRAVSIAVLVLGGALRLRQYLANRSLWLDELTLSSNIINRSYGELLRRLNFRQGAPVGWLYAEKTATVLFGTSERSLRLVPCVLSIASLGLFYLLTRRWLGRFGQVVACTLFAFSPPLISYAAQVKQYGTDVFFVLVVLLLSTLVDDEPTTRRIVLWATLSTIATWCSHAALIALAACGLVLLIRIGLRARAAPNPRKALRPMIAASLVFALSFALEYVVNLRGISRDRVLVAYWRRGSPPLPFTFHGDVTWLWHALQFLMTNPLGFASPRFALLLAFAGAIVFVARRGGGGVIVIAPIVAAIALSLAGKYPLHERLALYLAPCIFIAMAALAEWCARGRLSAVVAVVGLIGLVFVGASPVADAASVAWRPTDITDSRGPFAFVASHWQPGDALYTESPWTEVAYDYYGPRYRLTLSGTFGVQGPPCLDDPQFRGLTGYRRVWFVLTHRGSTEPPDRNTIYRSYFAAVGTPIAAYNGDGQTAAYLYDLRHVPTAVAGLPTWIHGGCFSIAGRAGTARRLHLR
jgi:hypothetical protein